MPIPVFRNPIAEESEPVKPTTPSKNLPVFSAFDKPSRGVGSGFGPELSAEPAEGYERTKEGEIVEKGLIQPWYGSPADVIIAIATGGGSLALGLGMAPAKAGVRAGAKYLAQEVAGWTTFGMSDVARLAYRARGTIGRAFVPHYDVLKKVPGGEQFVRYLKGAGIEASLAVEDAVNLGRQLLPKGAPETKKLIAQINKELSEAAQGEVLFSRETLEKRLTQLIRHQETIEKQVPKGRQAIRSALTGETLEARGALPTSRYSASKTMTELATLARSSEDDLYRLAGEHGIAPSSSLFTPLTKAQLAKFEGAKEILAQRIEAAKTPPYQEKLLNLAQNIRLDKRASDFLKQRVNEFTASADLKAAFQESQRVIRKTTTTKEVLVPDEAVGPVKKMEEVVQEALERRGWSAPEALQMVERLKNRAAKGGTMKQVVEETVEELSPFKWNPKEFGRRLKELGDLAGEQKIVGVKPLIREIEGMQRRFPGQAKYIAGLERGIGNIEKRVWQHYNVATAEAHFRRTYLTKEQEKRFAGALQGFGKNPTRLNLQWAMTRKDIPYEIRKEMGEVLEAAYPMAKSVAQLGHDIAYAKLYKNIADNPEWASSAWREGFFKDPIANTRNWGALRGHYVHEAIYEELQAAQRLSGEWSKLGQEMMSLWKVGKIGNPATMMRNIMSNGILGDVSGFSIHDQPKYMLKALKEYRDQSDLYFKARKLGLFRRGFAATELQGFMDDFGKVYVEGDSFPYVMTKLLRRARETVGLDKMMQYYSMIEDIAKFGDVLHTVEKGVAKEGFTLARRPMNDLQEAVELAHKKFFDYSDVTPFIEKIRRSPVGVPFITFTYKALPYLAESAVKHPLRFWKWPAGLMAIDQLARYQHGDDAWSTERKRKLLPDYMQSWNKYTQTFKYLRLPFNIKGKETYLSTQYILPWGDLFEMQNRGVLHPTLTPGGLLRPALDVFYNKQVIMGKPIYDMETILTKDLTPELRQKRIMQVADYLYKQYAPPLAPDLVPFTPKGGGYAYERLAEAILERKDKFGKPISVPQRLLSYLGGVKTREVNYPEERMKRIKEIEKQVQDVRRQAFFIQKNQQLSPIEKEKQMGRLRKQFQELHQQIPQ